MKILIADDSRAMRMIVVRTLRQAGFAGNQTVEAENGKQALEIVSGGGVDLILSDWNMPEMTGIDFLRALRRSGSSIPFCFVTSEGSEEMREQAMAADVGLISKPFTAEAFADALFGGDLEHSLEHSASGRHAVRSLVEDWLVAMLT
jgi:two-component system chemotaxis response regulator CheY